MSKRKHPVNVLEQAQEVLNGWPQISTTMTFGTLNLAALTADITAANTLKNDISKLEKQLDDKRNQRHTIHTAMWDKTKRAKTGVKANYGDDSPQFDLVGGTRISDRKSSTRKAAA
jgi:hypothetical protein